MRIGINALYLVPGKAGGLETVFRNLLSSIRKIDTRNEYILFTNREGAKKFDTGNNVREVSCPVSASFRPGKHLWEQIIFPFQLKKYRIDVLLSPGNVTPLFSPCPSVAVINDAIPFIRPESFGGLERWVLKALFFLTAQRCSAIITLSESAKKEIVRHLHVLREKVHVAYLAAEDRFRPTTAGMDIILKRHNITQPYIICVASSRPYKNIDGLVRAFEAVKKQHRVPHQLVVIGLSGKGHSALLQAGGSLLRSGELVFPGFVDDNDLPVLYSGAVASVYPSRYEGFGLPVLESMACGTPVVSSNAASLPEVVGDAGVLVDPCNTEQLSQAIFSVISDEGLRKVLREKGFERVLHFSWDKSAARIRDILVSYARQTPSP